ncbi:MAG: insulinase family protein [Deltaproteobacteria bacterium]|nr:insulinase family protein [Deltaproteobacteria bacterium]
MRLILLGLVLLPLVATTAAAATTPKLVKVTSVEGITEYRLHNGLRVLIFPDQSKPTVLVNITYLVGSRLEGYGETGMAHLLEHMLFKGTPSRPDIWKLLQDHGAHFNGTTWWDRTNYFEEMPASDENLEFALALEADRMVNSKIAAEDLAKEFQVVRNEFEKVENSPDIVLEDKMLATAYQWHNYGKSTIGSRSDIERVPIENLRAFYKRYYQPDNAILIVAGKFDEKRALELVGKYFGAIARPTRKLAPTWTVEPVQDGERQVTVRRAGDVAIVSLVYHGVAGADPDKVAEDAIVDILTNKPSGRLYKALVDKGIASEVNGVAYPMAEPGVMVFSAKVAKEGSAKEVRNVMIGIVESLGESEIAKEEIERWRAGFFRDFDLTMSETAKAGVVLSEFAAMGDWRLLFLTRDRVRKTTANDVARVARAYLKPSNRTLGLFHPEKQPARAPLPPVPDVAAMLKDYKGEPVSTAGEAFVATVENIEKRTLRAELPSGLKLALLPKKTKGGQVRLAFTVRFGSQTDLKGMVAAADLLPEMLLRGTRKLSFEQLKDKLDLLKAEVSLARGRSSPATANVAQLRVKTVRENLPQAIEILGEMLREPALARKEFEALRKEKLTKLEEQLSDPMANASVTLTRRLLPFPPDDVRYTPTIKENIERLRRTRYADLVSLHRRLWGQNAAQITVVGDFDPVAVREGIAKALADWKARKPYQRIPLPFHEGKASEDTIDTPDKEMAFVAAGRALPLRDDDPAYAALFLWNYMLGGSPSSRLFLRLRQKEGISYGAFSHLVAHPIDRSAFFFAGALAAPNNMDRALAGILGEVEGMVKGGVTEKELADAKQSYAKSWQGRIAEDDFVVGELDQGLFLGRTLAYWSDLNSKIEKLTVAEVNEAAKKFVDAEKLAKVRAGALAKNK